jgi:hypothetical protein
MRVLNSKGWVRRRAIQFTAPMVDEEQVGKESSFLKPLVRFCHPTLPALKIPFSISGNIHPGPFGVFPVPQQAWIPRSRLPYASRPFQRRRSHKKLCRNS